MNIDQENGCQVCKLAVCQWNRGTGEEQDIRLRDGIGSIWFGQHFVYLANLNSVFQST